jgi:hypothetical protein
MAFIPKDAKWYIGGIVLEFVIEDDPRNVVHSNTLLIEANSPEDAYKKALELGKSEEMEYLNTNGKQVKVKFRGLRDLNVIHDELEHGAELFYQEEVEVPERVIRDRVREKRKLAVFSEFDDRTDIPNYLPDSVAKGIELHFNSRDDSVK